MYAEHGAMKELFQKLRVQIKSNKALKNNQEDAVLLCNIGGYWRLPLFMDVRTRKQMLPRWSLYALQM